MGKFWSEGKVFGVGLALFAVWLFGVLPWYDASKPFPWATVAAVAAAASAIASAVSARANVYNTRAFERQLRNNTIDACIGAAIGLRGAIYRSLRVKVECADKIATPDLWAAYTEAWGKWVLFAQAFLVVRRYSSASFSEEPDNLLSDLLTELRPEFRTANWALEEEKEYNFQGRVRIVIDDVISKLKSIPVAD
jgi:hypothetical protein